MAMRCEEVQQSISDSLDVGQPCDAAIRRHVDNCPDCSAFERDCSDLDTLLTAGRMAAPAAGNQSRSWTIPLLSGVAAAIILFALLPTWHRPDVNPSPPSPQPLHQLDVVSNLAQAVQNVTVAPVRREMASIASDARAATNSLFSCLPSPSSFTRSQ
jgi:hypothetical protein